MPWKESKVIEEKIKFIAAWKTGGWSMSDLCREFGISRNTGYKYLERYESEGIDGLKERSRAPKAQGRVVRDKLIELVIEARRLHPTWGPRKLLAALKGRYPRTKDWPSMATIGRILKREGLVEPRRKRRRSRPVKLFPLEHVLQPNDVWCADFKGYFIVGDGLRCDPLTITDAHSRFLLACHAVPKTDTKSTQKVFEKVFRKHGLPEAIRTDNGSPFASRALAGLSNLSIWWLKLGIRLERIEPGKPYQNGRHERMHLTLKRETALPPRSSLESQQKAFDAFRKEFNFDRPHEALDDRTPSKVYTSSRREMPAKIPELVYPTNMEPHKVSSEGTIYLGEHRIFLSGTLSGETIGLEDISERHRRIHFATVALGVVDLYTGNVLQYRNPESIIDK